VIALVLGGTRSGKSEVAEELARSLPQPVTYVATGAASDAAIAARIAAHQARRPRGWRTVEAGPGLADALAAIDGTALIDSVGTWVAACDMAPDVEGLCRVLQRRGGDTVLVAEEVGLGVHPPTDLGVRFADAVGEVNRAVAAIADDVRLVVAGRTLRL